MFANRRLVATACVLLGVVLAFVFSCRSRPSYGSLALYQPAVIVGGRVGNLPAGSSLDVGSGGYNATGPSTLGNTNVVGELGNATGQFEFGAEYAGTVTSTTISGTVNAASVAGGGSATVWRIPTDSGGATLQGITFSNDGRVLMWQNLGPGTVTISNNTGDPTVANRILTIDAASSTLLPQVSMGLHYDGTQSRWVQDWIGTAAGSGTGTITDVIAGSNLSGGGSSGSVTLNVVASPVFASVETTSALQVDNTAVLRQEGDTLLYVATGSDVSLGSGLTSDWNAFGSGSPQSYVVATPYAAVTPGEISTSDTVIDGIVADDHGTAPIAGATRIICQSATNHGQIAILTKESSSSSAANQIAINADANAAGTSMGLAQRQCAWFVYDPSVSLWRVVGAGDGSLRRLSVSGYWNDTSLGSLVTSYDAGGTAGTHICGLTRVRLASAATTIIASMAACNPGDIKQFQVFSGGITVANNSGSGSVPFELPGGADKILVSGCSYWFQYDGPNAAWYLVMSSGGAC